jgi:ketosteroid isomerase-like protein
MTHPNETVLRNAYSALTVGDIPGFLALCTSNITFHVPGKGLLSGVHAKEAFLAKLGPAMSAVKGSFREEVVRVVADDSQGAVLAAQRAERDGKAYEWNAVHWWRIENGMLAEFWEYTDDQSAFDAAWHA